MMNAKMKKFSFKEVTPRNSRVGGGRYNPRLVDCGVMSERPGQKNAFRWRVSLSQHCMNLAGFKENERIGFEYDDGVVMLYKDIDGRTIGTTKNGGRGYMRFTISREMLGAFYNLNASEVETEADGRVCFKLV